MLLVSRVRGVARGTPPAHGPSRLRPPRQPEPALRVEHHLDRQLVGRPVEQARNHRNGPRDSIPTRRRGDDRSACARGEQRTRRKAREHGHTAMLDLRVPEPADVRLDGVDAVTRQGFRP